MTRPFYFHREALFRCTHQARLCVCEITLRTLTFSPALHSKLVSSLAQRHQQREQVTNKSLRRHVIVVQHFFDRFAVAYQEVGDFGFGNVPRCGARRMMQPAAHLVDQVLPDVPIRQWVLSLPIPLRVLLAAQPKLLSPVLEIVQRVITGHLIKKSALRRSEVHTGAVTHIQRFGSAANLNIHFYSLVLDGVYRIEQGRPVFHPVAPPTTEELARLLERGAIDSQLRWTLQ